MARYIVVEDVRPNVPFQENGKACWDQQRQAYVPWWLCGGLGRRAINRTVSKNKSVTCKCKH